VYSTLHLSLVASCRLS